MRIMSGSKLIKVDKSCSSLETLAQAFKFKGSWKEIFFKLWNKCKPVEYRLPGLSKMQKTIQIA